MNLIKTWMYYRRDEYDKYKFNHQEFYNYNPMNLQLWYVNRRFSNFLIKRNNNEVL